MELQSEAPSEGGKTIELYIYTQKYIFIYMCVYVHVKVFAAVAASTEQENWSGSQW